MNGDEHLKTYLLDDPETTSAERRAIEAHLALCADCRSSLESYRRARRLIAPPEVPSASGEFVERVISRVGAEADPVPAPRQRRTVLAWPAVAGALLAVLAAVFYFSFHRPEHSSQDLLAGGENDEFYEWATTSAGPSDEDVLKVVLEGL
jgi:predicted anti-sigma-YlaC factor YlaD